MQMRFNEERPIFMQVAEQIEDAILSGAFEEESQVPSTTEISVNYQINPATARKGMSLLVDEEILYKKRGIGMFVSTGAVTKIETKRKQEFFDHYIGNLLEEAKKLTISKEEIIQMIERGYDK